MFVLEQYLFLFCSFFLLGPFLIISWLASMMSNLQRSRFYFSFPRSLAKFKIYKNRRRRPRRQKIDELNMPTSHKLPGTRES